MIKRKPQPHSERANRFIFISKGGKWIGRCKSKVVERILSWDMQVKWREVRRKVGEWRRDSITLTRERKFGSERRCKKNTPRGRGVEEQRTNKIFLKPKKENLNQELREKKHGRGRLEIEISREAKRCVVGSTSLARADL
jgi:hypothetical protein